MNQYKTLDTNSLIICCTNGDPIAWAEFINRYSLLAKKAFVKRLNKHRFQYNEQDLEDLKQGFFIRTWQDKCLENLKNSDSINFWLVMASANYATDYVRNKKNDPNISSVSLFDEIVSEDKAVHLETAVSSHLPSPRDDLDRAIIHAKVDEAIQGFRDNEKIVLNLNIYNGLTHHEIADALGMPPGSVSSLLTRSKKKMRNILKKLQ